MSAYVENVDLISLRQTYNYREHEGKNDRNNNNNNKEINLTFGFCNAFLIFFTQYSQ
jgi:hypothetical protein